MGRGDDRGPPGFWRASGRSPSFASCLPQGGPLRFSDLEKLIDGTNQKMLIQQLKPLEKDGIVRRTVYPQVPPKQSTSSLRYGICARAVDAGVNRVGRDEAQTCRG
ncbi:winged helix-turn-helix transcriptional regulator [Paraburkholderia sp. RL17-368-BIF-A]|uniref:winged helix-turn-helix transcriptional regulator n=1 Tax=Paraburkholderia sp. RL17-368-BIF-A TaxID=3031628 RepID=UPI002AA59F65